MKFYILLIVIVCHTFSYGQQISSNNLRGLSKKEDSLKTHAIRIIQGINPKDRFDADSIFTRIFVRALKVTYSFNYPFDSLYTISKLYPLDSTFRIFTWQMVINENIIRQHGAIQLRTSDGSLKLFPLIDKSDITNNVTDTIANNYGWMGAVYYKIIQTKNSGHSYYTLLGYDENNIRSTKKVIEVLDFVNGQPLFGGRYFDLDSGKTKSTAARYFIEYKRTSSPRLTYDDELDMIIVEHLVSESNEPNKKWTLIPDGDYEGFKWVNGKWLFINKVFNQMTEEGNAPVPLPIRDPAGTIDETKLKGAEEIEKKLDPPVKKKKD
ncbi:MAG TPA: hypothetical protein VK498_08955 [Ferruginibacter sp.]|nr:hypothetical protein [Ferruginibacter sp.]